MLYVAEKKKLVHPSFASGESRVSRDDVGAGPSGEEVTGGKVISLIH